MRYPSAALAAVLMGVSFAASDNDNCTPCDDKPTPIMISKKKSCSDFPKIIATKCFAADNWVDMGFCRHTCFHEGRGYGDDNCCVDVDEPQDKDPAPVISDVPATVMECRVCDDKPTPNMSRKGGTCADFPNVIRTKCSGADNWDENGFCRYTCFRAGRPYDGFDDCCLRDGDTVKAPVVGSIPVPAKDKDEDNTDKNKGDDDDDDDDDDDKDKDKDKDKNDGGGGGGRLKMYCENKFRWQDKSTCKDWCLEAKNCKEGASLRIQKCGSSSMQKWKKDGNVLRPACSSKLCVSNGELKKGSSSVDGLSSGGKFEIKKSGQCLTQLHHPKANELVEFRSCSRARASDTSQWIWK
mmetsp:Transcript_16775/g.37224  ORF Transcript_16775/g.37224 Transcript_16775/m.37224 type:complete len:353 (-) Transcript_16775:139-1197(-)